MHLPAALPGILGYAEQLDTQVQGYAEQLDNSPRFVGLGPGADDSSCKGATGKDSGGSTSASGTDTSTDQAVGAAADLRARPGSHNSTESLLALFDEMSETSHTILACSKHIVSILDNVLDISKMEAGKLTLRKLPVSCSVICREIQQSLHR